MNAAELLRQALQRRAEAAQLQQPRQRWAAAPKKPPPAPRRLAGGRG